MNMKLIALALAGCFISALTQAQLRKGSLLFGGTVGYNSTKNKNDYPGYQSGERKEQALVVTPSFAVAIKDNLFLGADITFAKTKDRFIQEGPAYTPEINGKAFGAGVFVRKYWNIVDKLYIFGQGRAGYTNIKMDLGGSLPTYPPSEYAKAHSVEASLYPGLSLALSKKVHLESTFFNLFTLTWRKSTDFSKNNDREIRKNNNFTVGSSLNNANNFTLGIKVLLSK